MREVRQRRERVVVMKACRRAMMVRLSIEEHGGQREPRIKRLLDLDVMAILPLLARLARRLIDCLMSWRRTVMTRGG